MLLPDAISQGSCQPQSHGLTLHGRVGSLPAGDNSLGSLLNSTLNGFTFVRQRDQLVKLSHELVKPGRAKAGL